MSRWQTALCNAPMVLRGVYEYNVASRFRPLAPREWLFPVTYRCNARCRMCNIWQSDAGHELSVSDWRTVLKDPLFKTIQAVNLTGGEPTLRQDLPELTEVLIERLPALQRLTVTTNALQPERVAAQGESLLKLCQPRGIRLFVGVSLDGIGSMHDEMRNIPGAFERVQASLARLRPLAARGLRTGLNCTLTRHNAHQAESIRQWAADQGLPVNFIVASFSSSYYGNLDSEEDLSLDAGQREQIAEFLSGLASKAPIGELAAYFYADAARMLRCGTTRQTPCIFQKDAFLLDARGDLQYCMYSRVLGNVQQQSASELYFAAPNLEHRRDVVAHHCANCTITCFLELALAKDAFHYARFLLRRRP